MATTRTTKGEKVNLGDKARIRQLEEVQF